MGGILDLVGPGADICSFKEKNIPPGFPPDSPRNWLLKRCGIDRYDDLLLSGHRLLAQIVLGASGGYFKNKISASSAEIERDCSSTVYFPAVISYLTYNSYKEMHSTTVLGIEARKYF